MTGNQGNGRRKAEDSAQPTEDLIVPTEPGVNFIPVMLDWLKDIDGLRIRRRIGNGSHRTRFLGACLS